MPDKYATEADHETAFRILKHCAPADHRTAAGIVADYRRLLEKQERERTVQELSVIIRASYDKGSIGELLKLLEGA